jgi:DNA adenine methylase
MPGKAMKFFDVPPVRYMGSKWQIGEWVVDKFPPHTTYCEPFCGSAAVFFRKPPSQVEVLNDLNGEVIHFFDTLRNETEALIRAIELTPFSRQEYERSYQPTDDPLERARRFYVRSWQSFSGDGGLEKPTGWRHQNNARRGSIITKEWARLTGLWMGALRLKEAQLENRPALEVLKRYDSPQTLFYLDPPYVLKSRKRNIKRYAEEMVDDDHRRLAEALYPLKGCVLISGYDCALYRGLYKDWRCVTRSNTTNGKGAATEYLWISPNADDFARLPLWEKGEKR